MLKQKQKFPPQADQSTTLRKTGKNIIKLGVFLTLSIFAFLSYTYFTQAQIPDFVNYQGRLRDTAGAPITAATTIQFSLYNHLTNGGPGDVPGAAGDLLWTETYDGAGGCTQITPGDDGIFAQHLGDCVSFPDYLDFTQEYYLGVKIGADAEASPRVPLSTHPYAFTSKRLHVEGGDLFITNTDVAGNIVMNTAGGMSIAGSNAGFQGAVYNANYSANFTNRSIVDKEYVDEQLMWEILAADGGGGGMRIQPKNNSVRQIFVQDDGNSYTQFKVRNNNDAGNGAGAIIELKGSGADYTNNMYIGKYGASFWIPELRDNGAVLTDKTLVVGTASASEEIHFVTGNSYTDLKPVVVADNEGFRYTSDLSATFVDRTLVDKGYVDGAISGSNPTFQDVVDRSIAVNGFAHADFGAGEIDDDGGQLRVVSHVGSDFVFGAENMLTFNIDGGANQAHISDQRAGAAQVGIEYQNDYSANYTNRSLIDKEYVDNAIAGSANNVYNNDGTITQDRMISGTGAHQVEFNMTDGLIDSGIIYDHTNTILYHDAGSLAYRTSINVGDVVTITDLSNNKGAVYAADYSGNFVPRSLVDKAYVDSAVSGLGIYWTAGSSGTHSIMTKGIEATGGDAQGLYAVAQGAWSTAVGNFSRTTGVRANATATMAQSLGYYTDATADRAYANGSYAQANGVRSFIHAHGDSGVTVINDATEAAILGGYGGSLTATAERSVLLGGNQLQGTAADTVYVPYLNIHDVPAGTVAYTLGIDSNGNVIQAPTSSGGAIVSASNGLTKAGNDVQLGGILTSDTTITGPANSLSITDVSKFEAIHGVVGTSDAYYLGADGTGSGFGVVTAAMQNSGIRISPAEMRVADLINSRGLTYANDYSANFLDRSLVDKEYVDNAVLANSIYSTNGSLTGDRIVSTDGNNLTFQGTQYSSIQLNDQDEVKLENYYSNITMGWEDWNMHLEDQMGNGISTDFNIGNQATSISSNYATFAGIQYGADYSTNYTNRTLVDKEYVDDAIIAGSNNIYTANGTLAADRTVDLGTHRLFIDGFEDGTLLLLTGDDGSNQVAVRHEANYWETNVNGNALLRIANNGTTYTDNGNFGGIKYAADYAVDFTNRSLVDKAYVDNNIGVFENNVGVVRNKGTHASDDFVFGSEQLDDDGDVNHNARMFFDKSKSAFRAGGVVGNEWNEANLGDYSAGFGYRNTVSGDYAFSSGYINNNSGHSSVAMGYGLIVSGDYSVAMGLNNQATNHSSSVFGTASTATGISSFAAGNNVDATGDYSNASGYQTTASGLYSTAMGWGIEAGSSGTLAIALDDQTGTICNQVNSMCVMGGDVGIGTTTPSSFKLEIAGDVGPSADDTYDLGSSTRRWQDLYLGPSSLHIGTDGDEGILSYNTASDTFDFDHAINLGTTANATAGSLRWTGTDFEGHDGTSWKSFTSSAADNDWTITGNNLEVAQTGAIKLNEGSINTPALSFKSDSNTGIHHLSEDAFGLVTNGVRRLLIRDIGVNISGILGVTGDITANSNLSVLGQVHPNSGTETAPAYGFLGDTDTGMWRAGTNQLGFATAGVNRMTIDNLGKITFTGAVELDGSLRDINNQTGTAGQVLSSTGAGIDWIDAPSGGSSPASNDGAIQYNNGGSFGGDDSNFFWDDTNNRLGLGTNNPDTQLTLVGNGSAGSEGSIKLATYADAGYPSGIYFSRSRGTESTPTAITSNLPLGGIVIGGYDGAAMVPYAGGIQMESTENWSNTGHGNKLFFSTTENATTGMTQRMVIMDDGNIGIGVNNPAYKLDIDGEIMLDDRGGAPTASQGYAGIYTNAGELYAFNDSADSTQISPHNKDGLWWYNSTNLETGETLQIEMELLTKELNKILGGGYITENGEKIDKGISIIGELALKTDQSITTLGELQVSIDNNLAVINTSLTNLGKETEDSKEGVKDNKKDLATLSENISALTELTTNLVDTINNHETRITKLEDLIGQDTSDNNQNTNITELPEVLQTFAANLEVLEEDSEVKFILEGELVVEKITAEELVVEKITVDKIIVKKDTVGTAKIKEGKTSVKIKTSAVDENSHIILTPHGATPVGLADIEDGEGFTIEINEELNKDLKVEWFIVQGIE